jgi:dipeptidyl aminopeptidase/acylaminoacyl peptidase
MPELTPELIVDGLVPEDPRVSPDGHWVAFVAAPVGKAGEHPVSAIWLAPSDGATPARKLTAGSANDRAPRWSPDGRWLFFTSDRAERGKTQLYRISLDGGEAEPLTEWSGGIAGFVPVLDGALVAFWAKDEPTEEDERREHERDDPRVWGERVPYARLRILDLGTRTVRTIDALGDRHVAEVAPRPDGGPLAVFSWGMPMMDPGALDTQIHLVDLDGGTAHHLVTLPSVGDDLTWRETVEGWELWFTAQTPPNSTGAVTLFAVTVPAGLEELENKPVEARNLTPELPACVGAVVAGSGPQPLVTIFHGLDSSIARWDETRRELVPFFESPGTIQGVNTDRDRSIVALVRSGAAEPADIWAGPLDGTQPLRRISDTRPELREIAWGAQERLAWQAADGLQLDGLLVLPPGKTRADGPFPTITLPHGGPYSRYADDFQLRTSPSAQWLAHAGYAVFLPNPRGGMGHGHAFSSLVAGAVGLDDWGDIVTGLDILVTEGVADADRLGIGGWSQGGFMTAWAVGQTDRFKAGVMGAGVSDWGMMVATSDLPHFEADLGGSTGWEGIGPHQHDAISPISFAHRVKTPVLILHGEADERVPLSQAEFFARALREHGVPFEYVIYPREPHGVRERNHQIDLLRRTREWFDRWLRDDGQ